jgi:hypothetical protein
MQPLLLFDTFERSDASPKRHAESTYDFLNRSARPNSTAVRALLESWFAKYPCTEQAELRPRFPPDFHAAFLELFLFSYFARDGYHLTPHPQALGSTRTPDFLVEKGPYRFYLEATIATDLSDDEVSRKNVEALLLDAINDTPSPHFFLHLRTFNVVRGTQPAARRVRAFLERELPKVDPDSVDLSAFAQPLEDGPSLLYVDENISVTIGLVPRSVAARGRPDIRPIGIYPMQSRVGGFDTPIRDALNSKATRYGVLDLPYVIAVNCVTDWDVDNDDILDVLFGTEQIILVQGSQAPIPSRRKDGAFMGPNGPWNTRVSAVLIATLYPWNLGSARFEFYSNPWAAKPLTDCNFPARRATVSDGALVWTGASDLLGHFGLPLGWPDEPTA